MLSMFGLTGVGAVGKRPAGMVGVTKAWLWAGVMVVAVLPESCMAGLRPRALLTSAAQLG